MTAPTPPGQDPEPEFYRAQQVTVRRATEQAQAAWADLDPADPVGSWTADVAPRVVAAVEQAQAEAARAAQPYVIAALLAAGAASSPLGLLVAAAFAGWAANGLPLDRLLSFALAHWRRAVALGAPQSEARAIGLRYLLTYTATEIADAGRVAAQVAGIAELAVAGYERVVHLPACGRCVILAGRIYRYSDGFLRHPRCDCSIRPVTAKQARAARPQNTPAALFARMTRAEQNRAFGSRDAEAIRAGADMARVVNARRRGAVYVAGGHEYTREATTVRGIGRELGALATRPGSRIRASTIARPTAAQLVARLTDRDELLTALHRFGYLR